MEFSRARLRGHRQGRKLTHADLGERVDMAETEIVAIEDGSRTPTDGEIASLVRALDITDADLVPSGEDYVDNYLGAVMPYGKPMSDEDCRMAAYAMSSAFRATTRERR